MIKPEWPNPLSGYSFGAAYCHASLFALESCGGPGDPDGDRRAFQDETSLAPTE